MANHKSAIKRARQTIKRTKRNRSLTSALRTSIKNFRQLMQEDKLEELKESLPKLCRQLDKAVTKGIIHKKNAARRKSRFSRAFHQKIAKA